MPPKAKITKAMVIDAAFEITRAEGAENVNARTVAKKLGCSTQPVMYHFATIEDMKRAVYVKLDRYHTEYLMNVSPQEDVMPGIGLNYIRFAVTEPNLFRFLFQSGFAVENSVLQMIDSGELKPVLSAMQEEMKLDGKQTKEVFLTLALFVHGYASIIANNSLEFDETVIATHLGRVYRGAVLALQEEIKDEEIV
ncbi:MAG: TetR/AcrR family transcriptional regulator [Muribaculaceae bacterium]|nr:TetR/AcrR family transcriptional regulator [Muribaculaceae bacterium]